MHVTVQRKDVKFLPDNSRVVARFFNNGEKRTSELIKRVISLDEAGVDRELDHTLREFAGRHRNISKIFLRHFENHRSLIEEMNLDVGSISQEEKLLIGSYATMEYSIESAAMFNPSIIEDFDQSFLAKGEKRVIISFRATGEGHLSSIVFRRGILDANNDFHPNKIRNHIDMATIVQKKSYDKGRFVQKMHEMEISHQYSSAIMSDLPDHFDYNDLKSSVNRVLANGISTDKRLALEEMTWLVDSYYDVKFSLDSDISERVIFPISPSESRGIEDARFVRFTEDDGSIKVYATYTAYDGHTILPKLLSTEDFNTFRIMPMHGKAAQNKNFALFPKKINGKYAVLARVDGVNNYLMYSDRNTLWNDPIKIQEPKYPWEFTQIGNCGAPLWTEEGWLVITHGVGQMRRYCIGASLFDLDDPTKEIGRLSQPLLSPLEEEREGYVPNVVYSCGSLINNGSLVLPYAVSDYSSSYATVAMDELLHALRK
ncbi:glycoside hydrolase family 130 protein [Arenibacter sp. BSSL-BM3]|uniref:Glycoside hydrolase family 130 protein n=1 Tax=Arenibacter arenosicollis TaxID=2762274 RepID=A0ABR7QS95_9FLAO|nr:glycoside hydrolase family 130 protein [Arenibacter arenosicollis]MBC8770064.1 glycoside hydrolase family 130 protein [Arenibacter arenosicollis]